MKVEVVLTASDIAQEFVEAIEARDAGTFVLAMQFHPEQLLDEQPRGGAAGLEAESPRREEGTKATDANGLGRLVFDGNGPGGQDPLAAELGLELDGKNAKDAKRN